MKHVLLITMLALFVLSCKTKEEKTEEQEVAKVEIAYASYGDKIDDENVMSNKLMTEKYQSMAVGDTVNTKMKGEVIEVCQSKGCWMTLKMENGEEAMVKFKDYAFFMPKDIAGKEVIISGKAYVNEMPVDEQQHYAEDAGKTAEEVAEITKPKKTLSFEAEGVLIKQ